MIEKDRMLELRGGQLADSAGEQVGKLEEIYLDADTGEPEWALVHTGLFGTKRTFVPLAGATEQDGRLCVPLEQAKVKDAPHVEPDGQLTKDEEAALYRHYGIEPAAEAPAAEEPAAEQPPAEQPPAEQPPAEQPPADQPPAEE
jgi:sporulation protein YlmC with PRC-barrel domain